MQRIFIVALAILITLPVVLKGRVRGEKPSSAAFSVITSGSGLVRISGDVVNPGIYSLSANMLTNDVIKMAVSARPFAGLLPVGSEIRPLAQGDHLQLALQKDGSALIKVGIMTVNERIVLGVPLDINAMNAADFDLLPGIGPTVARRIIEYRQKNGGKMLVKELQMVEGIGEKKYKTLLPNF